LANFGDRFIVVNSEVRNVGLIKGLDTLIHICNRLAMLTTDEYNDITHYIALLDECEKMMQKHVVTCILWTEHTNDDMTMLKNTLKSLRGDLLRFGRIKQSLRLQLANTTPKRELTRRDKV
jgi:hypothetical protein